MQNTQATDAEEVTLRLQRQLRLTGLSTMLMLANRYAVSYVQIESKDCHIYAAKFNTFLKHFK